MDQACQTGDAARLDDADPTSAPDLGPQGSIAPTLIYIGGYGRSGSTLLECLLTSNARVAACGEVAIVAQKGPVKARGCTCGQSAQECSVWNELISSQGGPPEWNHEVLTLKLLDRMSDKGLLMVDSSKTAWDSMRAPFKLRRRLHAGLRLLHIVRNPRAVCWSTIDRPKHQKSGNTFLRCVRTAFGWNMANLTCEIYGRLYPDQYMRVRYEDLVSSPQSLLQNVFAGLLPDVSAQFDDMDAHSNRHQLRGNPMRHDAITFASVRNDSRWATEIPRRHRWLVACLTWPLRAKYDY
jgi:hypothetical protein